MSAPACLPGRQTVSVAVCIAGKVYSLHSKLCLKQQYHSLCGAEVIYPDPADSTGAAALSHLQ